MEGCGMDGCREGERNRRLFRRRGCSGEFDGKDWEMRRYRTAVAFTGSALTGSTGQVVAPATAATSLPPCKGGQGIYAGRGVEGRRQEGRGLSGRTRVNGREGIWGKWRDGGGVSRRVGGDGDDGDGDEKN
jgi:hypothetical protein